MTNTHQAPRRWKQVEELFHQALELRQEERREFLSKACAGDLDLEQEVISLLANYSADQSLLPAIDMEEARRAVAGNQPHFREGDRLEIYEILRLLGTGGMGEVYLARDTRLGRKVAIKVLSQLYSKDSNFLQRLQSEAQAASALNHPNILTIFAFGQTEGLQYIVSEYVEGSQLRELIGTLDQATAINYATQIARALAAAHSVGIIHRDIKPENIMVRPDGYLKVLDFGLAKFVSPVSGGSSSLHDRLSSSTQGTIPGLLLGTIGYMSPEQLRGQMVDTRTDIWSWGVVFYEMLTGQRPFEAETPSDVMVRILEGAPYPPSTDKRVNSILARTLTKRPDERYTSIHQVLEDFAQVRLRSRKLRSGVISLSPTPRTLARPSKRALLGQWLLWTGLVILLTLAGVGVFRLYESIIDKPYHLDSVASLTTLGDVTYAAISADSNYAAYAAGDNSKQSLHILQIATNADTERLSPVSGQYTGIIFSPDGRFLYFVRKEEGLGKLYRMPMLAGPPKVLASDVDSPIAFSPDGRQIAFERFDPIHGQDRVIVHSVEDEAEKAIITIAKPRYIFSPPAYSPDGRFVLFAVYDDAIQGSQKLHFATVRLRDNHVQFGHSLAWIGAARPIMLTASQLLVAAQDEKSLQPKIYELNWQTGESHLLTQGTWYKDLVASSNNKTLITTQLDRPADVWTFSIKNSGSVRKLTPSSGRFYGLAWTSNNNLIAQAESNGLSNLWRFDIKDGKIQTTSEGSGQDRPPITNPHSPYLVFVSNRDGSYHLWRSLKDGSDSRRLTTGNVLEFEPVFSPDGRTIIFTSSRNGQMSLWRVPIEGGQPVNINPNLSESPDISPDGKWIVCKYAENATDAWRIGVLNTFNGKLASTYPNIPTDNPVFWSAQGDSLIYVATRNGASNLWEQPIHGGPARQLTHFEEERIFAFALSPDRTSIAFIRGNNLVDAVLLQGSK
jgi:eukaryotic-like serine/threonine-protein kinase